VDDALRDLGVSVRDGPVTPAQIFQLLRQAEGTA